MGILSPLGSLRSTDTCLLSLKLSFQPKLGLGCHRAVIRRHGFNDDELTKELGLTGTSPSGAFDSKITQSYITAMTSTPRRFALMSLQCPSCPSPKAASFHHAMKIGAAIHSGWSVQQRSNDEIVILVSSLHRVVELGLPFVFTNAHAYPDWTDYYSDPESLNEIDWSIVQA